MKMPFTKTDFFDVFQRYNDAVFPVQLVFYVAVFLVMALVIKKNRLAGPIVSSALAILWLWMAIAYHFLFFAAINKMAYGFGSLFIVQACLLFWWGAIKKDLSYAFVPNIYSISGVVLAVYALLVYPVLGYFLGHVYPASPTFGLPCPTVIFTFGILLLADKKCPVWLLIIPMLWSVIGFMAALYMGVWEDTGLLIAGVFSVTLILIHNRKFHPHVSF